MKGLLIKEYLLSWRYYHKIILLFLLLSVVSCAIEPSIFLFLALYWMIFLGAVSGFALNMQEDTAGGDLWTLCLPRSRALSIVEKYLFLLCNVGGWFLICWPVSVLLQQADTKILFTGSLFCILSQCISIPLTLALGTSKTKLFYILLCGILGGLIGSGMLDSISMPAVLWILVGTILLLAASIYCSIFIYRKKQF